MKALNYCISIILLSVIITSCASFRPLTKEEAERVVVHEVKMDKAKIKTKLLSLVSEKFNSGKAVIQVNEDGLLSGNTVTFLSSDPLGMIKTFMDLTFIVKYEDNQYKVKYVVKNLYNQDSKSIGDISSDMWGRYAEEINKSIIEFDNMFVGYMSEDNSNF